jgi:hypothetical protein
MLGQRRLQLLSNSTPYLREEDFPVWSLGKRLR